MSRPASEARKLREAMRLLRRKEAELNTRAIECSLYRQRATKAEQEVAEWKHRFDRLLQITGNKPELET